MLPGAILGATYSPGFDEDLSSWRLVIDDEGNLFQDVKVYQWKRQHLVNERRQEQVVIGQDAVIRLLLKTEEIGFTRFQDSYSSPILDLPLYRIYLRFGNDNKTVDTDHLKISPYESSMDLKGFCELWEAIHQQAPFTRK